MIDTDLSPPTVRHRAMIQGTRTRSVRAGRVAFLSAVACAVALGGAAYALGGEAPAPQATPAEYGRAPEPAEAALALGYQPGSAPSERRIAAAQHRARVQPGVDAYVDLALAMLQRRRETSDAAYLQYAVDAAAAAEKHGEGVRVLMVRALIAQDGHRFNDALDMAREIARLTPSDPFGHLLAGDALLELGRYDDAIDAYQRALNLRPDLRSYNRAGYLRWLHGDFAGAIELIEHALDAGSPRDPESMAWCYVDLGNMYLESGDAARALASADRSDKLLADYAPALGLRARALAMRGEHGQAIALLEKFVARLPHVAELVLLAEWLAAEGRHDEARTRLTQAESLAAGDPRPMAHYYARHDIERDKALKLAELELTQRENIAARDTQALALMRAGRLDAAATALDEAMRLGTRSAEMLLHKSLLASLRGDRAAARTALERALEMNPHVDPTLVAELTGRLEVK